MSDAPTITDPTKTKPTIAELERILTAADTDGAPTPEVRQWARIATALETLAQVEKDREWCARQAARRQEEAKAEEAKAAKRAAIAIVLVLVGGVVLLRYVAKRLGEEHDVDAGGLA